MTSRIRILPYGPSDSCNALKEAIRSYLSENRINASIQNLRSEGSIFRGRTGDLIINYGNRRYGTELFGSAEVLNKVEALNRAANKLTALNVMSADGVSTVEYTADLDVAMGWHENSIVYARSTLTGHSGEGITVHVPQDGSVIQANQPLYTRGIQGQRREWRVHVFKGVITYVQKKIRRNGYREDPNYREDVRNHHTGWVYSNQFTDTPNDAVLFNAVKAVEAMGLDFGAVDVISRGTNAWVLEVNTAPGLSGTTLETYQHNIVELIKGMRSDGYVPQYREAYAVPEHPDVIEVIDGEEPEPDVPEAPVVTEAPTTVTMPPVQAEGLTEVPRSGIAVGDMTRGLYMADILHPSNAMVMASNVVLFFCGRNFYRHGWNHPIPAGQITRTRRIASITDSNSNITTL